MIDVIIRTSGDAAATRRCLESVRAARCERAFEVCVVEALGVEAALRRNPDRDVVLLAGECEVADGWIDRLAACVAREPRVATVTPFSNDGGICSYPRIGIGNWLPEGETTASLDALFGEHNRECAIEIPASPGFCMLITRAALAAAGPFADATAFCAAASGAGFNHFLCADVFVRHDPPRGSAFADGPQTEAMREFMEREPARPWRRRVDLARLRRSARPRILLVSHDWGGGVERHVRDVARMLAPDCEVLRLRPDGPSAVSVEWLREGEELQAWFEHAEWDSCLALLRSIGVARVHLHHIHELPRAALDIPAALGVPYDVTLHDYFPICPQYHLGPGEGEHCRDPEICDRCLARRPAQWDLGLAQWRELFHGFLLGAARVIVPSRDMATRVRRYFPDVALLEWTHPETPREPPAVIKVALLGGISAIKGARILEACVADAARRKLPLHFHVVGHVDRPMRTWPEAPLTVGGSYPEESLPELLALQRPDAFLFLSQVHESYSYTLSAAMATGLPIVATRVGAFPERLRGYRAHSLVAPDASAASINDALLAAVRESSHVARALP